MRPRRTGMLRRNPSRDRRAGLGPLRSQGHPPQDQHRTGARPADRLLINHQPPARPDLNRSQTRYLPALTIMLLNCAGTLRPVDNVRGRGERPDAALLRAARSARRTEHGQDDGEGGQPAHHRPGPGADDPAVIKTGSAQHATQARAARPPSAFGAQWGRRSAAGPGMAVLLGEVGEGDGAAGARGADGQVVAAGCDGGGQAIQLLADGTAPCRLCRPDTELGFLDRGPDRPASAARSGPTSHQ